MTLPCHNITLLTKLTVCSKLANGGLCHVSLYVQYAVLSYLARPFHRLSGAGSGEEGEAAALKASAKEAGSLEDKQLAEALAR